MNGVQPIIMRGAPCAPQAHASVLLVPHLHPPLLPIWRWRGGADGVLESLGGPGKPLGALLKGPHPPTTIDRRNG